MPNIENKPTVIYIIADRRSGSTLLENMLSKSEEIISVGELAMLKGHIFKEGPGEMWEWHCSCGKPVLQCDFWSRVLRGAVEAHFETKITWPYKFLTTPLASLSPRTSCRSLTSYVHTPENAQTTDFLKNIYETISGTYHKKFIVDSSKDAMQALAVYECKEIDAKFIWLIRDLRAVTFSKLKRWQVNKRSDKGAYETMLDSYAYKKLCKAVLSCMEKQDTLKLHYEAVADDPQKALDKICSSFGLKKFTAPEFMELTNDHTIAGTPGRFESKPIAADNSWRSFYEDKKLLSVLGKMFNAL